jgi:hypothetical protein
MSSYCGLRPITAPQSRAFPPLLQGATVKGSGVRWLSPAWGQEQGLPSLSLTQVTPCRINKKFSAWLHRSHQAYHLLTGGLYRTPHNPPAST